MTSSSFQKLLAQMLVFDDFPVVLAELIGAGITDKSHPFRKEAVAKARGLVTEADQWPSVWEEERDDEGDIKRLLSAAETHQDFACVYEDARQHTGDFFLNAQREALLGMIRSASQLSHITNLLKGQHIALDTPLDSITPPQQDVLRAVCERLASFCEAA